MTESQPDPTEEGKPTISIWHKGERLEDMLLGHGFISGDVDRRTYKVGESEKGYAYKNQASVAEARRTHNVYSAFKEAGLPVAGFLKTSYQKAENEDTRKIGLIMQDVTNDGTYRLVELEYGGLTTAYIIDKLPQASDLKKKIVRAMAIIHNLGFHNFHPTNSFFLRINKGNPDDVDFVVLDYSNFCSDSSPRAGYGVYEELSIEQAKVRNINQIVWSITHSDNDIETPEMDELLDYYYTLRSERVTHF